jgi:shikimate dehydrogenase
MKTPDSKTQLCAILGHPVGHSLSPAMHNAAFAELGIDAVYVAHDVLPEHLGDALHGIRALGYRGLSITIPHKVAALSLVDEVDQVAERIGCINTIVQREGRLFGTNSDGLGALCALRRANADPRGRSVVVLGSGGAARAISITIASEAAPRRLVLLGIIPDELHRLGEELARLGTTEVITATLDEQGLSDHLPSAELCLHTTPVGMSPKVQQSVVPADLLHPGLTVFDAVYTPRRTRLLRDAEARGARVVEGLEMFLGQAEVQFRLFTEREPPTEVMRSIVVSRLGAP